MDKKRIALIMATKGFLYKGTIDEGYNVYHPYKERGLFYRLLREFVFRIIPIFSEVFYIKKIVSDDIRYSDIIIWDPLITQRYIKWIRRKFPKANIHFIYWNMVGKATHILPSKIPSYCTKWTYDAYDSSKYNLKLYSSYPYFKTFLRSPKPPKYDVLFVGKDKGRAGFLLEFEKNLQAMGLRTKFIITAEAIYSKKKDFYQQEISYDELCELISESRSVLNIVMENQMGLTLRDLEYVFQSVKLITNNKAIIDNPIYHPNNVYVIETPKADGIKEFLGIPFEKLDQQIIDSHTLDAFIKEIIS